MGEDYNDEEMDLIILSDEEGNDVRFEYLDTIEYDGESYIILVPIDEQEDDDGSVVILRIDDNEDGEQGFSGVDDMEVLDAVFAMFKDKFKDTYNFGDDEE